MYIEVHLIWEIGDEHLSSINSEKNWVKLYQIPQNWFKLQILSAAKIFLDRVVLSRLVVEDQALAEELKSQIVEDGARFEQLVQEYSVEDDRIFNGMMGAVSRGTMPDVLRASVDLANTGELIGPLEINGLWYLIRVEKLLEASLEEQLKQELKDELFNQWLEEKSQKINVKLQVKF